MLYFVLSVFLVLPVYNMTYLSASSYFNFHNINFKKNVYSKRLFIYLLTIFYSGMEAKSPMEAGFLLLLFCRVCRRGIPPIPIKRPSQ